MSKWILLGASMLPTVLGMASLDPKDTKESIIADVFLVKKGRSFNSVLEPQYLHRVACHYTIEDTPLNRREISHLISSLKSASVIIDKDNKYIDARVELDSTLPPSGFKFVSSYTFLNGSSYGLMNSKSISIKPGAEEMIRRFIGTRFPATPDSRISC